MNNNKDYYKILEIERNATEDDIKKSYRKLALKYHPDRCKEPGSEEKFKEISEAYSILSTPDKKKQYDVMGSTDDFNFGDEDPFSVFNNIFQQHLSTFMNMQYDNEINMDNIFTNLSGGKFQTPFSFGNIHIKVHTSSSKNSSISNNINNFINPFDIMNNYSDEKKVENNTYKNTDINKPKIEKQIDTETKIEKPKIKKLKKPDDIVINLDVNFCDIYNEEKKTITVKRNRKRSDGTYSLKTKKIEIPIYGREIIIKGEGHEYEEYSVVGDIFISINNKIDENFKRMNDYDMLTFIPITFEDISKTFTYKIVLPNNKTINVLYEKDSLKGQKHLFQKIKNFGIPYYDETNLNHGDLYVLYYLSFNESEHIDGIISEEHYIAKNCNIDDIFQNNV